MSGKRRAIGIMGTFVLAVGAAFAVGGYAVSSNEEWTAAADRRITREDDRDAIRADVAKQEQHLREVGASIGGDPIPVHDEPLEYPKGTDETVLGGDSAIGDFTDVFVDEGIVLQGISAKEVKALPRRPLGTLPPRPQSPITPKAGSRLVAVTIRITNRSGDGADPGCGFGSELSTYAYNTDGERVQITNEYSIVGTYPTSCGAGIADGASADIVLGVGMKEGEQLKALQFTFLGGDGGSDDYAPLLVLDKPV